MPVPGLLIGLLLAPGPAAAAPPGEQILKQAETAYRQGLQAPIRSREARRHFARAAGFYEELRRRGANNPDLYRNLGQAYLLAGDLSRAILSYRRGLDLDPGEVDLQNRLEDARNQVMYSFSGSFGRPPVDNWPPWLPRLPVRLRLLIVVILHGLAWVSLSRWWMTRQGGWLWSAAPSFAVAAFLGGGLVFEAHDRAWEQDHPLVVIAAPQVVLHKGNGANYPCYDAQARTWSETAGAIPADATPLPRGVEARLRYDKGDWLQIELAGGEVGWVRRRDVLIDRP